MSILEHHMKYLWILKLNLKVLHQIEALLSWIHANWLYSLKCLLKEIYQAEFCDLWNQIPFCRSVRIMLVYSPLSKTFKILSLRNNRNRSAELLLLTPDWYLKKILSLKNFIRKLGQWGNRSTFFEKNLTFASLKAPGNLFQGSRIHSFQQIM